MSRKIIKDLKVTHNIKDRDFLGYKITRNSTLTIHHIIKKVYYEIDDPSNYALLVLESHNYLHSLERTDLHLYNEITSFFLEAKEQERQLDSNYFRDLSRVLRKER